MQRLTCGPSERKPGRAQVVRQALRRLGGFGAAERPQDPNQAAIDAVLASMDSSARDAALQLDYAVFDRRASELHIVHDSGLYSCLTVTLWSLLDLLRVAELPRKINFTHTLSAYKDRAGQDLFPALFDPRMDEVALAELVELAGSPQADLRRFDHHGDYRHLSTPTLRRLVAAYFRPNAALSARTEDIGARCLHPHERYAGVCWRGTDKATEVQPVDSALYIEVAERLLDEGRVDRILIQTDQEQVSHVFRKFFGDRCDVIDKLPRTRGTIAIHHSDSIDGGRLDFARDMMSAVALLARMEQVVVYTGNVGAWVALLRGRGDGLWQATPAGIVPQWT